MMDEQWPLNDSNPMQAARTETQQTTNGHTSSVVTFPPASSTETQQTTNGHTSSVVTFPPASSTENNESQSSSGRSKVPARKSAKPVLKSELDELSDYLTAYYTPKSNTRLRKPSAVSNVAPAPVFAVSSRSTSTPPPINRSTTAAAARSVSPEPAETNPNQAHSISQNDRFDKQKNRTEKTASTTFASRSSSGLSDTHDNSVSRPPPVPLNIFDEFEFDDVLQVPSPATERSVNSRTASSKRAKEPSGSGSRNQSGGSNDQRIFAEKTAPATFTSRSSSGLSDTHDNSVSRPPPVPLNLFGEFDLDDVLQAPSPATERAKKPSGSGSRNQSGGSNEQHEGTAPVKWPLRSAPAVVRTAVSESANQQPALHQRSESPMNLFDELNLIGTFTPASLDAAESSVKAAAACESGKQSSGDDSDTDIRVETDHDHANNQSDSDSSDTDGGSECAPLSMLLTERGQVPDAARERVCLQFPLLAQTADNDVSESLSLALTDPPTVNEHDEGLFKAAHQAAAVPQVNQPEQPSIIDNDEEKQIKRQVQIGKYVMDALYTAHYPPEYVQLPVLYICEFCLHYCSSEQSARHALKCTARHPPGNELYRYDDLSMFEVDGEQAKLFCQNLCFVAKLFLDHKAVFVDIEPFLFYVLTENDATGCHVIGYFSKEKYNVDRYNLACIVTLPCYQKLGYGRFLIDFSFALSRVEGAAGRPEQPFSELGHMSYMSYWRGAVLECLYKWRLCTSDTDSLSLQYVAQQTGIAPEDVAVTFSRLRLVRVGADGNAFLQINWTLVEKHWQVQMAKGHKRIWLHEQCLRYTPKDYCLDDDEREQESGSGSESSASKRDTEGKKEVHVAQAHKQHDATMDSAKDEHLDLDSAKEEHLDLDSAKDEHLDLDSAKDEHLVLDSAKDEHLDLDSTKDEHLDLDSTKDEHLDLDSTKDEHLDLDSTKDWHEQEATSSTTL